MYNCKICGYFSNDASINSCQNPHCINFANFDSLKLPNDASTLAYAVVPFQRMTSIFKTDEVLKAGTIFPELYMPYTHKIFDRS